MTRIFKTLLMVLTIAFFNIAATAVRAEPPSQFGRYLGVLKHSQIAQDQLAKLDFIVSRQSSSEFKLIAVVSLYFGDYESKEYVSYHFNSVTYNMLTGALVFDQPDQEITLIVDRFAGGHFVGRLRSVSAGDVGALEMSQNNFTTPDRPLVQPLWGEYRGLCDGISTVLQVQTNRSSDDHSRMGNPFGTFELSAQLAEVDPSACMDSTLCVNRVYDTGSYNFFQGKLDLLGRSRNLSCNVTTTGLECEQCTLKRTSHEAAPSTAKTYPTHQGGYASTPIPGGNNPASSGAVSQLGGNYQGYIFHERLGVYQAVGLNIATYQGIGTNGNPALFVSAVSSMYFGGFNSSEYVTSRFNEKEFPLLAPQIVLERIDGDVDTVIQLTQLGNGKAKGIWYSILFGRVGAFELTHGESPPTPPVDAPIMGPLTGIYKSGGWDLDLRVVRESTPINSVNPFYPLNFKGAFQLRDITANIKIANGAYDFYTGKLGLRLEDETMFTGFRPDNMHLSFKRPTPGVIRPLTPHQPQSFLKVSP